MHKKNNEDERNYNDASLTKTRVHMLKSLACFTDYN